jgi:hypothetical protein
VAEGRDADEPGAGLLNATFAGTGVLVATSVAAAVAPDSFELVHAWVAGALFVVGVGAFLWAYALGIARSRTDLVSIPGLFFLAGETAPPSIRRPFRVALVVEVVAVVAAALIRPYTAVAFGILAPMFAMGLMATWGGRHGRFPPRPPKHAPAPADLATPPPDGGEP